MANRFLFRRDTPSDWLAKNPILGPGEPGIELGTNRLKFGDGVLRWLELPYFVDDAEVRRLVQEAVAELGAGGDGSGSGVALMAHVNSLTPHPVYDDGPSLLLFYQNAKV